MVKAIVIQKSNKHVIESRMLKALSFERQGMQVFRCPNPTCKSKRVIFKWSGTLPDNNGYVLDIMCGDCKHVWIIKGN